MKKKTWNKEEEEERRKKKKKTPICIGSDQKLFLFLLFIRQDVTWILFEFRFKRSKVSLVKY